MKIVLQRVSEASVHVEGSLVSAIGPGLLLLVGIAQGDDAAVLARMADKVANLRIFEDDHGKMNRSVLETGGEILAVSQFTLFGDCRKGRRPNFMGAAPADEARDLFQTFATLLQQQGLTVKQGVFQATMDVRLTNHGPVTLLLDTSDLPRPQPA